MRIKHVIKNYGIIALGSMIFGVAFNAFFAANQVAMGGITGLAQVINAVLPVAPVGVLSFIINIPLFLLGWKYIGFHLLASSLFSMAVSSAAIDIVAALWDFQPMDPMLACLCGGAVMGAGLGLVFTQGATTGREKQVLMVAFKQKDIVRIKEAVHDIDPTAFLIVCDAHDVLGEGFGDYQKEDI